jgi:hypothetical protein
MLHSNSEAGLHQVVETDLHTETYSGDWCGE